MLAVRVLGPTDSSWFLSGHLFAENNKLVCYSESDEIPEPYFIEYSGDGVALKQSGRGAAGAIQVSFTDGKSLHRFRHGGGRGQLIAKAVGLKKGFCPQVLDLTAGLGKDAFVLASLGCSVTMLERVPVVQELLSAGLSRLRSSEIPEFLEVSDRLTLVKQDARTALNEPNSLANEIVYLDPMYPDTGKSAAVKKEMRAFHDLVGQDLDASELLQLALAHAHYRVVVKRPRKGSQLEGPDPTYKLEGKSTRYDIYALKKLPF